MPRCSRIGVADELLVHWFLTGGGTVILLQAYSGGLRCRHIITNKVLLLLLLKFWCSFAAFARCAGYGALHAWFLIWRNLLGVKRPLATPFSPRVLNRLSLLSKSERVNHKLGVVYLLPTTKQNCRTALVLQHASLPFPAHQSASQPALPPLRYCAAYSLIGSGCYRRSVGDRCAAGYAV